MPITAKAVLEINIKWSYDNLLISNLRKTEHITHKLCHQRRDDPVTKENRLIIDTVDSDVVRSISGAKTINIRDIIT